MVVTADTDFGTLLALSEEKQTWSQGDVWGMMVEIIADQLDVDRESVVPEARFIEDLSVS